MNKSQLIDAIAEASGLTKIDTRKALDAFIQTTVEQLKQGDKISLAGFGTLSVSVRNGRVGRNPKTGSKIEIVAKKVVRFKSSSELSNEVQ